MMRKEFAWNCGMPDNKCGEGGESGEGMSMRTEPLTLTNYTVRALPFRRNNLILNNIKNEMIPAI
jgi:hypothetical protein